MADKNIQIKNLAGDSLFPKTQGAIVINNNGENLGDVEAGAQVNKIETITVDGVTLEIVDKAVEISLPEAAEYTIVQAEVADDGMSATYQLAKDGVAFGTKINIAKDMVVSGGSLKKCTEENEPVEGLEVGDPYIELTIANSDDTKLYIPVKDLVDVYTAGDDTIEITDNKIKVNIEELQETFYTKEEVDAIVAPEVKDITELQADIVELKEDVAGLQETVEEKLDVETYEADKETFATKAEVEEEIANFLTYEELA